MLTAAVFGGINPKGETVTQLLNETDRFISELPEISLQKKYRAPLSMLQFEFHFRNGQEEEAGKYFDDLAGRFNRVLLYANTIHSSAFLLSALAFAQTGNRVADLPPGESLLVDLHDSISVVRLGLYQAMRKYYSGETKAAISELNDLLNKYSFKDTTHLGIELRLTLAYLYIEITEYDMAENLLRNTRRKMKEAGEGAYNHVNHLVRVFQNAIKYHADEQKESDKDDITLFTAKNNGQYRMLVHLLPALKNKYLK